MGDVNFTFEHFLSLLIGQQPQALVEEHSKLIPPRTGSGNGFGAVIGGVRDLIIALNAEDIEASFRVEVDRYRANIVDRNVNASLRRLWLVLSPSSPMTTLSCAMSGSTSLTARFLSKEPSALMLRLAPTSRKHYMSNTFLYKTISN